ncbi:hypothetical protein [Halodesulfovibrio aestuarii]|uniref:Uncharacterized protein n=1 Tax=Halodesulfovibrio aestuarii TaxID=126333 RepID=A0ABV4JWJ0_9BACT
MNHPDFTKIVAKFSPFIEEVVKELYPSQQVLRTRSWHNWIIPYGMDIEEFTTSLSFLLGEYDFAGAYREELTDYSFDEDPREPQVFLHVRCKTGAHVFLLTSISNSGQYSIFNQIIKANKIQLHEVTQEIIAMIDEEVPMRHHEFLTGTQLEKKLEKHSSPYLFQANSAKKALGSLYDILVMNYLGHSIKQTDIFILEESEHRSLCAFILFRGGFLREAHVGVPIYASTTPSCIEATAELILELPMGVKTSFLQNSPPVQTSYSRWLIKGIEVARTDLDQFIYALSTLHFIEDQSVSISTIHFNERGMTSKNDDSSVLSLFNFAVPRVKHVTASRVSDAFCNARLSAVPPTLFSHSE